MAATVQSKKRANNSGKPSKRAKLSRLHKPEDMTLEGWQIDLRREFGRQQPFQLENRGSHAVFSDFSVANPQSKNAYQVTIRGPRLGENSCTCPDFMTNTLGTCKHIEFVLHKLESNPRRRKTLQGGHQPAHSEIYLQYGALREPRFRAGSACPRELSRLASKYFTSDGSLMPETYGRFEDLLAAAGKFEHELRVQPDVLGFVAEARDDVRRRQVLRKAFPRGAKSAAFRKLLRVPLYEYQRQGALFAANAGRSLIGDDMGLGKTVQALAAAEIMARHFDVERVLIICPTSLKHQWQREIERFTNRDAQVINGLQPRRAELFRAPGFFKITNYDTIHRDLDAIAGWAPDLVILDEAQRIKNWSTRAAQAVKKIDSRFAVVLTGTPLENRLEELVSIVQFVDQHRLGPTFRFLHDHQQRDETGRVVGYRSLDRIGKTLAPLLLRRRKDDVLAQLPKRLDKTFFVDMTPRQRELHEENREIVARLVFKWRRYKYLSEADQLRLRCALQNMRMVCDSSYLLDQSSEHGVKADELITLLDEMFETHGTKVVIFSQWLRMHEIVRRRLEQRRWDHVLFHGGVPGGKRGALIDRFRDDVDCKAFLSTDAGGVGLNLQFASVVVNLDLPWNPAVLEQRIGRVHRLGQERPVQVVNFVAQGTIESGILELLKFKRSLFSGVLDGGDKEVFMGGGRLKRFMETVDKATTAIAPPDESSNDEATPARTAQPTAEPRNGDDPWTGLLRSGMALLQEIATPTSNHQPAPALTKFIQRDERTGESFLRLPVPKPEVVQEALAVLGKLFATSV